MTTENLSVRIPRGAPGDTVAVSALVRDLAVYRPGVRVGVSGAFAEDLFRYDPRVTVGDPPNAQVVEVSYRRAIDASASDPTRRYLAAAHECYTLQTGDVLPLSEARPSLVLGPAEKSPPVQEPYAVVAAGVKSDMPVKLAPPKLVSEVVRQTVDLNWKQVGRVGNFRLRHHHWEIPDAENLLGQTDLRQLMRLIAHARVVLCHVSLPMLLAAAFRVPCVVLGGGREDPWFHECPGVHYLHTIGRLACCMTRGCRTSFARPAHDGRYPLGTLCADPVVVGGVDVGRCMTLVPAEEVAALVRHVAR